MAADRPTSYKPRREIAEEVSTECDSDKVAELSQELIKELDKQSPHAPERDKKAGPQKAGSGAPRHRYRVAWTGNSCMNCWRPILTSCRSESRPPGARSWSGSKKALRIPYPGNTAPWTKRSATCEDWRQWQHQNMLPEKLFTVAPRSVIHNLSDIQDGPGY